MDFEFSESIEMIIQFMFLSLFNMINCIKNVINCIDQFPNDKKTYIPRVNKSHVVMMHYPLLIHC